MSEAAGTRDINVDMEQVVVSRSAAVMALRKKDGNVACAILALDGGLMIVDIS